MVKLLEDICLTYISRNIKRFPGLGLYLKRVHKSKLLERLCYQEMFIPDLLPCITRHLFSDNLQWINFSHSSQITDKTLETLSTCQCQLTSITIHDCNNITDKGIEALVHITKQAERIILHSLSDITGEGLKHLAIPTLTELILKNCVNLRDDRVIEMVQNCPNVNYFGISSSYKLTDRTVIAAAKALQANLKGIWCDRMTNLTSESTLALAKWCPKIAIASFEKCTNLEGQGLLKMAKNCSLQALRISYCTELPPMDLDMLIKMLHAKNSPTIFDITGNTLGNLGVEFLSTCKTLTHLVVSEINQITDEDIELICRELGRSLIELDITSCETLTEKTCDSIAQHTRSLEQLGMGCMGYEITGMGLCPLFQDPTRAVKIKHIDFGKSKISPSLIMLITKKCPNLEILCLSGIQQITNDIVVSLAHNCPNLETCSLNDCDLSDSSICELSVYCNKLQELSLAGTHKLTNKSVISLADNCPHIYYLDVSGCEVTMESLKYFKTSMIGPVLHLTHDCVSLDEPSNQPQQAAVATVNPALPDNPAAPANPAPVNLPITDAPTNFSVHLKYKLFLSFLFLSFLFMLICELVILLVVLI